MQKITLPLVMIASLATLVSCGQVTTVPTNLPSTETPAVTGVVVTPPATTATASMSPVAPVRITRTEIVTYISPANPKDPIEFSVTVSDGLITAASATPKSDNEISIKMQTAFSTEVSSKVVGKKAADLKVDAIGGSSLTTTAFETFVHAF